MIVPGYFMTRKQTDRLNFYGSVTHVRGHKLFNLNAVKLETWKLSSMPTLLLLNFTSSTCSCDLCFCAYKSAEHVK
jgi:hypothetical protein